MSTTRTARRGGPLKWHPPPPPTPRIIHFPPRRHRRKPPHKTPTISNPLSLLRRPHRTRKLESLFDEERCFSKEDLPIVLLHSGAGCERRERVVEDEEEEDCGGGGGGNGEILERERGDVVEERERDRAVEVEMLRAECRFLRMEREVALKKLERNKIRMERTLRSAVHTLLSGRKKIGEGKSASMVIEEEIEELAEKLMVLQRSSGLKDLELRSCSNFDKQVSVLQRRLEKLGGISDEKCVKEIREMAEASMSINASYSRVDESFGSHRKSSKFTDVRMEALTRKMEGLSRGMLFERMKEEYGSMLSTANSSVASSASNSRRIEYPDPCSTSLRQPYQETMPREEMETACSGRCKAIVRRIVEQVRAETEQWSQMQEMLGQVKEEMEELQASRDFWEDQAIDSGFQIQSLHSSVQEWEQKALTSEAKANELQAQISALQAELERTRMDQNRQVSRTKRLSSPISLDEQNENEKEKRVLICRLKENHHISSSSSSKQKDVLSDGRRKARACSNGLMAPKRSPFRDIGNSSPLVRHISKAIFPLHCAQRSDEML